MELGPGIYIFVEIGKEGLLMTSKLIVRSSLILSVLTVLTATLSAQHIEIYPNAGFIWPRHMSNGQNFEDQGI